MTVCLLIDYKITLISEIRKCEEMSISESINYDISGALLTLPPIRTRPYEVGIFTFTLQIRKQTTLSNWSEVK